MKILDSEYIIKYYGTYFSKANIFIVLELVKDGDLFDYIDRLKFLEEYEASLVILQLMQAIEYMNKVGVVHRDLKPENILLEANPDKSIKRIKLIDFGVASLLEKGAKVDHACGTPGYLGTFPLLFGS